MYFVISPNGYSGYGKTLQEAVRDMEEQDERHSFDSLEFYKAEKIKVELRQVPTPVEISKTPAKKQTKEPK